VHPEAQNNEETLGFRVFNVITYQLRENNFAFLPVENTRKLGSLASYTNIHWIGSASRKSPAAREK
jgi:hypothetical protein